MRQTARFAILATVFAVSLLTIARADTLFTVTLNTSGLAGLPSAGPFELAFQLTDGGGLGDGNNTATLSNFEFGAGGSAAACPAGCTVFGGASGSAGSSIVLSDTGFFNALVEGFTPGSSLSFLADLTTNVDAGGVPDAFAFSILDGSGFSIPTLDPSGADTFVMVRLDSAHPTILTYGSDPTRPTGSGVTVSLGAPVIGTPASTVPEPNSFLWMGFGLASLALLARREARP